MRTILRLLFGLIAISCAFVAAALPSVIDRQIAKDRAYYQQFQVIATYTDKFGKLPKGQDLQKLESETIAPTISHDVIDSAFECDQSFHAEETDKFVLSFWRGEWSECYAYPSGRTTLLLDVESQFPFIAFVWLIAAIAGWGAIVLRPKGKSDTPTPSNFD